MNRYPEAAFLLETWGGGSWNGVVTAQQLAAVPPRMQCSVRAQDVALPLAPPAPGGQPPLSPDQPALALAGRPGTALPVVDHDATVGVILAADVAAMVARGTPVPRRTWNSFWPPAAAPSGYA